IEDEGKFLSGNLQKTFQERLSFAFSQSKSTLKKLLPYVLLGVALGAVVHGYVPRELIEKYVGGKSLWAVLLAVAIGIPIYAGCSTIVPVIFSISAGGVPLGTALAFMMAIAGLSLPEALILKRTMKLKLLLSFFGIVALGIILIGFLFNLFLA
ncbi:MAG: permease, partial [Candidatus Gracilibacteria bacterium]|nr:permease [Candidatus Gracilibacteria bacterium]